MGPQHDADAAAWARDLGLPGIFDIHVHFMPDRMQQAVWRHFDSLPRAWGIRYRTDDETRLQTLKDLGVLRHTALAYAHRPGVAAWLNEFTLDFADNHASALGCFTFYPEPTADEYVSAALQRGAQVAKVHLQVGKFDPMDAQLAGVWRRLEAAGTAVVIHAGAVPDGSGGEAWCGMDPVRRLLERWPGLQLVLAHMGAPDYDDAVQLAREFPQLRMDTAMVLVHSGAGFEYPRVLVDWLAESPTRVLFGSDFPSFPHHFADQVRGVAMQGFGDDWLRRVFWENGAEMFGQEAAEIS